MSDHRSKNDESDRSGTSSDAAGVARGAVKTASTLSRTSIGRLPKSISVARPISVSGVLPKKLPIKQIAKVSDRISTGFDAYDAVSSSGDGDQNGRALKKGRWEQVAKRATNFSGSLLRNTILGAGLFESFETTILYFDRKNCEVSGKRNLSVPRSQNREDKIKGGDAFSRTSLNQHFGAGMVGGSIHSFLQMSFQSASFIKEHGFDRSRTAPISSISSWIARYTLHHAIAHGFLFASYEGFKRSFISDNSLPVQDGSDSEIVENSVNYMMAIALTGGIAGQLQHIISHYTELWLGVGDDRRLRTPFHDRQQIKLFVRGPSFKSTLLAFPPSAIGFIAFDFGKSIMNEFQ